ncbi:MAG: hypothetical protein LBU77_06865 [Clostridiales bacterium]|jgi:uncharacterized protein YdeI (YjbR/CyaY-like superfamily)|nr:hypothetical protein [Clostridiales bacterium]
MRADVPELTFPGRADFRAWLGENAETSGGVWLVFGKTKPAGTLSATDALEEALCFGWIDGQMKSIDDSKYIKYFAPRREKSVWSEKNKHRIHSLRERNIMTPLGEKAVADAVKNGQWNAAKASAPTDEQIAAFAAKLSGYAPAYENFKAMSNSVRATYTRRYLSFKNETARERDFEKIIGRLNKNLKPM